MRIHWANLLVLGTGIVLQRPIEVTAQVSLPVNSEQVTTPVNEIGGKVAFETLRVILDKPNLPLRYGSIKTGSETVQLDGRTLVRDKDYFVDYISGVVYLKCQAREGQSLTINYRYDESKGTQGTFGINSSGTKFQGFTFALTKNSKMILGMGLTERLADGTVLSSNVYGFNNTFGLKGGSIKGLFMVGDRQKVKQDNLFGDKPANNSTIEEGKSQAIVQNLTSKVGGGQVSINYQDIGEKFGGFSAFESGGYSATEIGQFASEKGLKRTNFSLDKIGKKGFNFSSGSSSVGDDQGAVTNKSYGAEAFGLKFNWSDFKVDPGFTRFNDIREADRNQLARERGLERQSFSLGTSGKRGKFELNSSKVEGLDGFGFYRQNIGLETGLIKANFLSQHVQQGFTRFRDLREGDRDQLAREQGLVRQNSSIESAPKSGPKLNWSDNTIRTDTGDFTSRDFGFSFGKFNLKHGRIDTGKGFASLSSLSPGEINQNLSKIVKMINPTMDPQGQDGAGWAQGVGLNRSNWALDYTLNKSQNFSASTETIEGSQDKLSVNNVSLNTGKVSLNFRNQKSGKDFNESGKMLFTEQQNFGTAPGLEKTDINLAANLNQTSKIQVSQTKAQDQSGDMLRQILGLAGKGYDIAYSRRKIDSNFSSLGGMVDSERDLLTSLVGFDQSDIKANWQVNKAIGLQYSDSKAINDSTGMGRFYASLGLKWNFDSKTQLAFQRTSNKQTDPTQPLINQQIDTATISRDFGHAGRITMLQEKATFDGSQDSNPDSVRQSVIYENQITKSTGVRTEQSMTRFENGEHETRTSNSLIQTLTPRVGVSVTDTKVEREGDKPSETHRDYGFWVDFGKNIRLNYKAVRNMQGESTGDQHSEVGITPGQVQGVNVGSASYQRNGWDDQRDQHIGNVSLSNVKPLRFGFLQDVRFNYGVDSVRDQDAWQKEYRTMGFGARIGSFAFGIDYKSQALPAGDRAIDRILTLTTDTTGKSWLRADVKYNLRTLPFGQQAMIRNYTLTAEPIKHWQFTHSLMTNPLQADPNAMLGAVATPGRTNKWGIAFDGSKRTKLSMTYEEFMNEQNNQQVGSLKIGALLFANNPSPLNLEYVVAESNASGTMQRSHGFNLGFNQRPGPNQSLAFRISNLNWELARPADQNLQNWNMRLDYSWRF